jgi:hypothetical protein
MPTYSWQTCVCCEMRSRMRTTTDVDQAMTMRSPQQLVCDECLPHQYRRGEDHQASLRRLDAHKVKWAALAIQALQERDVALERVDVLEREAFAVRQQRRQDHQALDLLHQVEELHQRVHQGCSCGQHACPTQALLLRSGV